MKKIFLLLSAAMLLLTTKSNAQFTFGVKAGGTFGKIDGESFKQGYNFGINAGVFAELGFNEKFGIQPEILFNQTNTTVENNTSVSDVLNQGEKGNLNYLSIPVLLRITPVKLLSINVGPQFGILLNKHNNLVQNGENAFKTGDFGLDAGVELNFNKLRVYGRYNVGLANVSDVANSDKWKNQQIQAGIGIVLF